MSSWTTSPSRDLLRVCNNCGSVGHIAGMCKEDKQCHCRCLKLSRCRDLWNDSTTWPFHEFIMGGVHEIYYRIFHVIFFQYVPNCMWIKMDKLSNYLNKDPGLRNGNGVLKNAPTLGSSSAGPAVEVSDSPSHGFNTKSWSSMTWMMKMGTPSGTTQ